MRRNMSARELIKLMGNKHVLHKDYKGNTKIIKKVPNLAGRYSVLDAEPSAWQTFKSILSGDA